MAQLSNTTALVFQCVSKNAHTRSQDLTSKLFCASQILEILEWGQLDATMVTGSQLCQFKVEVRELETEFTPNVISEWVHHESLAVKFQVPSKRR